MRGKTMYCVMVFILSLPIASVPNHDTLIVDLLLATSHIIESLKVLES